MSRPAEAGLGARRRQGRRGLVRVPAALLLLGMATALGYLGLSTPSGDDLPERVAALAGGKPLRPGDVPLILEHAVVAVEDERFYQHHGLDTIGTARALWVDLSGRCACEGGSTVTQQLAKTVYYPDQGKWSRKLPGMAVALKIELRYDKREIMADYLSVVTTGYGLVGARQAACAYFGRALIELSAAEAAEIAGSVQVPAATDPRYHPDEARERRDYVLDRMLEVGYLDPAQMTAAKAEPVLLPRAGRSRACS
ncbi:MAG TPA: biosynthetic peptidoglycan transglycosylase [Candidatus Dormibacteraeota bacterium]|nr:biosynthetic peptidoglycan transglycosylase [Candidatus Dormibacteraeota bacterium]